MPAGFWPSIAVKTMNLAGSSSFTEFVGFGLPAMAKLNCVAAGIWAGIWPRNGNPGDSTRSEQENVARGRSRMQST